MRFGISTQRWSLIFLCLTLMMLLAPMLHQDLWSSDDWRAHFLRMQGLNQQLDHQQFPPLFDYWSANQYGYSWGAFYPPLTTLIFFISRLLLLGFDNIQLQMKISLSLIILISTVSSYYAAKKEFSSCTAGYLGATLFISSSYYLCNIFQRFAIGECMAMALMPLFIRGCIALTTGHRDRILIPIIGTLIFLSNIPSTIILIVFFIVYFLINLKTLSNINVALFLLKSAAIILLLTLFYWMPLIYQMHYSDIYAFTSLQQSYEFMNQGRVKLIHLFLSTKNTSGTIGYALFLSPGVLIVVLSLIAIFRDKTHVSKSMMLVSGILIFLITPFFSWTWMPEGFIILKFIQFPWRILSCCTTILSLYAVWPLSQWLKKTKYGVVIFPFILFLQLIFPMQGAIFSSPPEFNTSALYKDYLNNRIKEPFNDQSLGATGYPILSKPAGFDRGYPNFHVDVENESTWLLPYVMYSGYYFTLDGKKIQPVPLENGFIGVHLSKGTHHLQLEYSTRIYLIPAAISFTILLFLLGLKVRRTIKPKKMQQYMNI